MTMNKAKAEAVKNTRNIEFNRQYLSDKPMNNRVTKGQKQNLLTWQNSTSASITALGGPHDSLNEYRMP